MASGYTWVGVCTTQRAIVRFMRHKSACAYHSPPPLHQQMHPRRIKAARRILRPSDGHNARVQSSRKNRYTRSQRLHSCSTQCAPCWAHLRFLLCYIMCARGAHPSHVDYHLFQLLCSKMIQMAALSLDPRLLITSATH